MNDERYRNDIDLPLSSHVLSLLVREQGETIRKLEQRIEAISRLCPTEFLANGLHRQDFVSNELRGMLDRTDVSSIMYMFGKMGWQIQRGRREMYVSKEEIVSILTPTANEPRTR